MTVEGKMTKERAIEIFNLLAGMGYACAVKHIRGSYAVEVPVTLRGDKAYGKQTEIIEIAKRGGFEVVQAGQLLRVIG